MADTPSLDLKASLVEAEKLKAEGNSCFRAGEWPEAIAAYRAALDKLPNRPPGSREDALLDSEDVEGKEKSDGSSSLPTQDPRPSNEEVQPTAAGSHDTTRQLSPDEEACAKARAVLNANIGACHVKLADHKQAVDACTEALQNDPQYVKALQRRASSNEVLNTWTSLTSAQEDYNTLFKIFESSPTEQRNVSRSLAQLKPRLEVAQKRETDEMLGKLKDLGNSLLGNFGLSTDNFKFTPNGQGGYSMNFQR